MANFIPFQQSALFSNITGGGGQPLGAVPMNFATATPYTWNTNPITPEPDTPESDFDMGVFCSVPANANHPMCVNKGNNNNNNNKKDSDERPYMSIEDMKSASDEELIDYLKDGWIGNSILGYLPSKGDIVTVNKPLMGSPLLKFAIGKQQDLRYNFIINELTKRGFVQGTDKDGNVTFNINPQLYKENLDKTATNIIDRQDDKGDVIPVVQDDGTVQYEKVDRTGGDYYQKTKPTSSHLTRDDGRRDEDKYRKALKENIIRSVKNTDKEIRSRYSESLGGFTGGK
jgi:hypothetical protein